jgi:hypothetical protein
MNFKLEEAYMSSCIVWVYSIWVNPFRNYSVIKVTIYIVGSLSMKRLKENIHMKSDLLYEETYMSGCIVWGPDSWQPREWRRGREANIFRRSDEPRKIK